MEIKIDHPQAALEALSEIALAINTVQEPDELLDKVLQIAMSTLEAERGLVLLTAPNRPEGFEVKNSRNLTPE